ncbi:major facilitator superfamily domain-containing protein [Thamnocephalis sphaerospora]|uniref:Major facilitator superfamily domain-containing protein n=1 Tax=Thamnocephalis sphaerospora TaxID=78915 RepID=A0A4P9XQE1_9FUNG|nr:major facilitator superfamily domain-containing protein [Thamnocephalis sphaerospora]|eukprot:RKP07500.1 major facilitator superfamily domain-containing protein [Thamnocephalis sphaerospora]
MAQVVSEVSDSLATLTGRQDVPSAQQSAASNFADGLSRVSSDTQLESQKCSLKNDDISVIDSPQQPMSLMRTLILFAGLAFCVFLCSLDQTIVATAIPRIASDFNSLTDVAWIGSAYLLATAAVTPLYGRLTAIFGLKQVFLFALAMFLVGSLGCALSNSMVMLIVFRAVSGIGGESMYALALVIITTVSTPKWSATLQGWFGAVFAVSAAVGPLLGGVFTDKLTWRWAFYINLPFGAVSMGIIIFGFYMPPITGSIKEKLRRIDYFGAVLLLIAVITLLLGVSWGGNTYPWDSAVVISLFCVAAVACAAFIWVEGWHAKQPFIPGRVLNSRNVALTMITSFLSGWVIFSLVYYVPLFYQLVRNKSATDAGLMLIPLMVLCCICTAASTMVIGRYGRWTYRSILTFGFLLTILSLGLCLTFWEEEKRVTETVILALLGAGLGSVWQSVYMTAQASCQPRDMPVSTMLCSFFQVMGATIGLAVTGSVFNNASEKYSPELPVSASAAGPALSGSMENIHQLPEDIRALVIHGLIQAFHILFISLIPPTAVAALTSVFIRPRRWSEVQNDAGPGGAAH